MSRTNEGPQASQEDYERVTADPRWEDAIALTECDAEVTNDDLIVACQMVPNDHIAPFVALRLLEQREDLRSEVKRLRDAADAVLRHARCAGFPCASWQRVLTDLEGASRE